MAGRHLEEISIARIIDVTGSVIQRISVSVIEIQLWSVTGSIERIREDFGWRRRFDDDWRRGRRSLHRVLHKSYRSWQVSSFGTVSILIGHVVDSVLLTIGIDVANEKQSNMWSIHSLLLLSTAICKFTCTIHEQRCQLIQFACVCDRRQCNRWWHLGPRFGSSASELSAPSTKQPISEKEISGRKWKYLQTLSDISCDLTETAERRDESNVSVVVGLRRASFYRQRAETTPRRCDHPTELWLTYRCWVSLLRCYGILDFNVATLHLETSSGPSDFPSSSGHSLTSCMTNLHCGQHIHISLFLENDGRRRNYSLVTRRFLMNVSYWCRSVLTNYLHSENDCSKPPQIQPKLLLTNNSMSFQNHCCWCHQIPVSPLARRCVAFQRYSITWPRCDVIVNRDPPCDQDLQSR